MKKLTIKPMNEPNKIINYWKKEKFVVTCIVIFELTFNITTIIGPIYQGKLIDSIIYGDTLSSVIILALTFGQVKLTRYYL